MNMLHLSKNDETKRNGKTETTSIAKIQSSGATTFNPFKYA